jgi:hypothetical protein
MNLHRLLLLLLLGMSLSDMAECRTFRVLYPNAPSDAPHSMVVHDGKGFLEVELPKMNFSDVYELPDGPLKLRFLKEMPEDAEPLAPDAPMIDIAEHMLDFYLLVFPSRGKGDLPIRTYVVSAADDKLRRGQMLWFNGTPHAVAGMLGNQKIQIPPEGRQTTDAPTDLAGDFRVNLFYRTPGNPQVYPLTSTVWIHDPRSKHVAFVVPQPHTRTPRIMVYRDFR